MKEYKIPRSPDPPNVQFFRSISLYASRGTLWPRASTGRVLESDVSIMCPTLKLSSSLKTSLQRLLKDVSFTFDIERYIKAVIGPVSFNEIELQEVQLFTHTCQRESLIRFVQGQKMDRSDYEVVLKAISLKIDGYEEYEYLESADLCVPIIQCCLTKSSLKLISHLVFPSVSLAFQPIGPLKIVSTSLSVVLTKKENGLAGFHTGYLTLDQKKRVLPLKVNDKHLMKYPLVGVWTTGIKGELHQSSLAWAACVRFLESQLIHERISPNIATNTFLFMHFSPKPAFFEVSTTGKTAWKAISRPFNFSTSEIRFFEDENQIVLRTSREKKSMTASTSSSEARCSQARNSFESDSTEKMILKQNLMLKNLEKQITELQHALSEPKLINAETNTTSYFKDSKTNTRFNNRRQSAAVRESVESITQSNPLRSSCNIESAKLKPDSTIFVPKIIYKPDSESDEDNPFELNYLA